MSTRPFSTTKAGASEAAQALRAVAKPDRVPQLLSFFKTGPGQYAEGDRFLGIYVPDVRIVARQFSELPIGEIKKLLASPWHEERLLAVIWLVQQFEEGSGPEREAIFDLYLASTGWINNWDLVDVSTPQIVGGWLYEKGGDMALLRCLAKSASLWERRIAILATFYFIRKNQFDPTLKIATLLMKDPHDLIHKAVGWMLREVVKRDQKIEEQFLDAHATKLPRTALRYAIERFPESRRKYYLSLER